MEESLHISPWLRWPVILLGLLISAWLVWHYSRLIYVNVVQYENPQAVKWVEVINLSVAALSLVAVMVMGFLSQWGTKSWALWITGGLIALNLLLLILKAEAFLNSFHGTPFH